MERDRLESKDDPSNGETQFLSTHRLSMLADVANVDFWTIQPDGSVTLLSDPSRRNEFNHPQAINKTVAEHIHPDDRPSFLEEWLRAKDSHSRIEVKYRYLIDDEYRWQRARAIPIRGQSGDIQEWLGVTEDIHDAVLTENERNRFFDAAIDLTAVYSFDGQFKRLGSKWSEVLGWSYEELIASPISRIIHPDDSNSVQRIMARLKHLNEVGEFESRVKTKGDQFRWFSWRMLPFPSEQIFYASATDITERKSAEESLRSSEENYRSILHHAAIGIVQVSLEGYVTQTNDAVPAMLGYSRSELIGKHFLSVSDPKDHPDALGYSVKLHSGTINSYCRDTQLIRKDNSRVWGHITVSLVRDIQGNPDYYVAIVEDISSAKAIADALIESEDHYRFMVDSSPQMPWTADASGTMTDFSDKWLSMTNLSRDEASGIGWRVVLHPDDFHQMLHKWRHSVQTGTFYEAEHRTRIADGSYRWMRARAVPRRDADGNVIRWYGSTEDIHEQKQFENELEDLIQIRTSALNEANVELIKARDTAIAALKSKSIFLANMSHEIRTPMNAVIGLTSLLREMDLPEDANLMVETIAGSGETLLRVIDDILDFSRIEANKLDIERTAINLDTVASDVITLFQNHASAKGISLTKTAPKDAMPEVLADPVRLRQILANLISNGIKFTGTGGVHLIWDWAPQGEKIGVTFYVKDSGTGIPHDRISAIFESFTQADGSTQRRYGGSGLGLTICKRLVELMGGTITVESQVGIGSTFCIQLVFDQALSEGLIDTGPNRLDVNSPTLPLHVLLAEDNEVIVMVTTRMLEHAGCTCEVAENGLRAIALAATSRFDLILMDVQMPTCDGLEATRIIRATEIQQGKPPIPIYALTANAMSGDRIVCIEAGMDGFLAKPIPVAALQQVIAEVAGRHR